MELRHLVAYGLIAVAVVSLSIFGIAASRRQARRKLRMRGVKDHRTEPARRGVAID